MCCISISLLLSWINKYGELLSSSNAIKIDLGFELVFEAKNKY
jgi:hypothetical protein